MAVEYRVKKITRYIVTRFESGVSSQIGEYPSSETALSVGYALCKQEHQASGEEEGSMSFIYPTTLVSDVEVAGEPVEGSEHEALARKRGPAQSRPGKKG